MTWQGSRRVIRETIDGLGYVVYPVAPRSVDDGPTVSVILSPPARESDRYPGGQVDTDYHQRIMIMYPLGDGNDVEAAHAVDDASEAITDAFHGHVVLEGEATETEPVSWEEAFVDKYPPGGSVDFAMMIGLLDVGITKDVTIGA